MEFGKTGQHYIFMSHVILVRPVRHIPQDPKRNFTHVLSFFTGSDEISQFLVKNIHFNLSM
jgi:hypothetical protein